MKYFITILVLLSTNLLAQSKADQDFHKWATKLNKSIKCENFPLSTSGLSEIVNYTKTYQKYPYGTKLDFVMFDTLNMTYFIIRKDYKNVCVGDTTCKKSVIRSETYNYRSDRPAGKRLELEGPSAGNRSFINRGFAEHSFIESKFTRIRGSYINLQKTFDEQLAKEMLFFHVIDNEKEPIAQICYLI